MRPKRAAVLAVASWITLWLMTGSCSKNKTTQPPDGGGPCITSRVVTVAFAHEYNAGRCTGFDQHFEAGARVWICMNFEKAQAGDKLRLWIKADAAQNPSQEETTLQSGCAARNWSIGITPAALGRWTTRVYINDQFCAETFFYTYQ